jgi:hypothetical protein
VVRQSAGPSGSVRSGGPTVKDVAKSRPIIAGRKTGAAKVPQDRFGYRELPLAVAGRCGHCDILRYCQRQRGHHVARGQRLTRLPIQYDLANPFYRPGNPLFLKAHAR